MANLVTKFRYYKPKKSRTRGNYAKYVATRDGVEKFIDSASPATTNQKKMIEKILRDYPDSMDMLEYEDYLNNPTVKNASEFIARAIEDDTNYLFNQTTYADYIATRPRVEKQGSHGLFSSGNTEINLEKVLCHK